MTGKDMHLAEDIFGDLEKKPSRDGFGKGLVELGEKDENIWVLTADVSGSTRTNWFADRFPKRFVQIGVAEQNMAGVAAGIAACGKTVFLSAYGVFSPGRNWDQLRVSVCYNDVPVVFHASHTGLTVGPDGASHQALEDIAMIRALPNLTILVPSDMNQVRKATLAAAAQKKPAYIRSCREKMPVFTTEETPFEIGKANVYREGKDVAIFACGPIVHESLKAAAELEKKGISCAVVDCHTIKPIDEETIKEMAKKTGLIITIEEHQITGGLGGAVAEVLAEAGCPGKLVRHGVQNRFGESGPALDLLAKYKLDAKGIEEIVSKAANEKK